MYPFFPHGALAALGILTQRLALVNNVTPVPRHILVSPLVEFMSVERNALFADRNIRDMRADLRIEAVAVHAEVFRRIAESEKARLNVSHYRNDSRRDLTAGGACPGTVAGFGEFQSGVRDGASLGAAMRMCLGRFCRVHACNDSCVPRTLLPGLIPQ